MIFNKRALKQVNPHFAKNILCVLHGILSMAIVTWIYNKGGGILGFLVFFCSFLIFFIRGVLWANIAMQAFLILIAFVSPFVLIYRHMLAARKQLAIIQSQMPIDYTEVFIYLIILEVICFGMIFLLKKSKPIFLRSII